MTHAVRFQHPRYTIRRKFFRFFGDAFHLYTEDGELALYSNMKRFRIRDLVEQLHFIGVKSQSVVLLTGAFTGMVMCAQFYIQFHKVKMDSAVMSVVSVAMARELGAVLTSLMIAGRVGAAMAAQLGTMKVTEQIDALRTLATSPVDYLVAPRLLAMFISLPLLTAEAIAISLVSGMVVAVFLLGLDPVFLWSNVTFYTWSSDIWMGLIKAFIFAGIIATVACHKGMHCGQGAEGVGKATTCLLYTSPSPRDRG